MQSPRLGNHKAPPKLDKQKYNHQNLLLPISVVPNQELYPKHMSYSSKLSLSNIFVIFVNYTNIIEICVIKFSYRTLQFQNHKMMNPKNQFKSLKILTRGCLELYSNTLHVSVAYTCSSALIYLATSKCPLLLLLIVWKLQAQYYFHNMIACDY